MSERNFGIQTALENPAGSVTRLLRSSGASQPKLLDGETAHIQPVLAREMTVSVCGTRVGEHVCACPPWRGFALKGSLRLHTCVLMRPR